MSGDEAYVRVPVGAFKWLMGEEGDFVPPPDAKGNFWWRSEFQRRIKNFAFCWTPPIRQEQQAIDRALWSEIGLAIGRIESALESVCGELLVKDGLLSYRTQQKALLDGLALKQVAILEFLVAFKRQNEQLTEESRAIVKERGDRLLAIELSLETLGLQQDVIEKKLDERIAPSKTFGDWWHSVGHTHMPKNGEPPIHASIAELAWNAALRAQPKRKRERKGKRLANRTGK